MVEEEDPYSLTLEDIYDTVDTNNTYSPNPVIHNRPPAPIPRPEAEPEPEQPVICRGVATISDFSAEKYCICSDYIFYLFFFLQCFRIKVRQTEVKKGTRVLVQVKGVPSS